MPAVSLIIPYKNTAAYLRVLLDSVFRHELPFDLQVIVVNDHSTENNEEYASVIRDYDARVEFYENAPGVSTAGAARNTGLQHAKGQWLLFADADDYFLDGWETSVSRHLNDIEDIIYFKPTSRDENGREHTRHLYLLHVIEPYLQAPTRENEIRLKFGFVSPCFKLIRAALVRENNIRFDEIMYANDVMFSIKCASYAKKITAAEDVIYCAVRHQESLTTHNELSVLYKREQVICERYNFCKSRLSPQDFRYTRYEQDARSRMLKILRIALKEDNGFRSFMQFIKLHRKNHLPFLPNPFLLIASKIYAVLPEPIHACLRKLKRSFGRK